MAEGCVAQLHGDMKFDGKPKYQQVEVSISHGIFNKDKRHGISSIATAMGFPVAVKALYIERVWCEKLEQKKPIVEDKQKEIMASGERQPKSRKTEGYFMSTEDKRFDPYENLEVMQLMVDADTKSELWGRVDAKWYSQLFGSIVLVVRPPSEDLTVNQLEALCYYSKKNLIPKMESMLDPEDCLVDSDDDLENHDNLIPPKVKREEFRHEYLLSGKFERFFEKLKQKKLEEGDASWADTVSPRPPRVVEEPAIKKEEEDVVIKMEDITMAETTTEETTTSSGPGLFKFWRPLSVVTVLISSIPNVTSQPSPI